MGTVIFFALLLALIAFLVGPIVGVIGLFKKNTKLAVGGFVASGAGIILALVLGVVAAVTADPDDATIEPAPYENTVPSPR